MTDQVALKLRRQTVPDLRNTWQIYSVAERITSAADDKRSSVRRTQLSVTNTLTVIN